MGDVEETAADASGPSDYGGDTGWSDAETPTDMGSPVDRSGAAGLDLLAATLVTEHQDLDRTQGITSLRPRASSVSALRTGSIRPRLIVSAKGTEARRPSSDNAPGDPDYEIVRILGQGGMGTVHLARQIALGRDVALKQIQGQHCEIDSVRAEFLTEAVLTGRLEHPNIVPVYEVGHSSDNQLFYSMKNIRGLAWSDSIGSLTLDENLDILTRVCDAVAYAHAEGVVHRDLKPQNVMTGSFGEVLVLDWGLAIMYADGESDQRSLAGTPAYMAPEMATPPFAAEPRSDVYLLGGLLHSILTGVPPHGGKTARECLAGVLENRIHAGDAERCRRLDPSGELLGIARRALATAPSDRFAKVTDLQAAIRQYRSHRDSLELSGRARGSLKEAETDRGYEQYSRAIFGFEEALKLWEGNTQAAAGASEARLAWALCAESQGDFDLSLSLLDEQSADHKEIRTRVTLARKQREARQQQVRRLRRFSAAASLVVAVVASVAAVWINSERGKAIAAQEKETLQRTRADDAAKTATAEKFIAEKNAYDSDMLLGQRDWEDGNAGHLRDLLERHETREDLKGFEWFYWDRLRQTDLYRMNAHSGLVTDVAFSPNGTLLASAGWDRVLHIRDAATQQVVRTLDGYPGYVWGVAFSPDGARLASASGDLGELGEVRITDVETGVRLKTLKGNRGFFRSVKFSPDGQRIVTTSRWGDIGVWDVESSRQLFTLQGHTAVFSPTENWLACAGSESTIGLFDATDGRLLRRLAPQKEVNSVAVSLDGKRLATADKNGIRIWDVHSGNELVFIPAQLVMGLGHSSVVRLVFSPDGRHLASPAGGNMIQVWDSTTGARTLTLRGHTGFVQCVAYSPDGSRLVSGSEDGTVRVWDSARDQESLALRGHTDQVHDVVFSSDGERVASAGYDQGVRVWDATTGREIAVLRGGPARNLAFNRTDTLFAARIGDLGRSSSVRVWDTSTWQPVVTLERPGMVTAVAFSPDGTRLVSSDSQVRSSATLTIWDASSWTVLRTVQRGSAILCIAFNPQRREFATVSANTIHILDGDTGQELRSFQHPGLRSVAYSGDGTRLASSGEGDSVKVWDPATGLQVQTLRGHTSSVYSVAFSKDGRRVASASLDGTVRLWDADTGQQVLSLKGHSSRIYGVALSQDGTRIASASADKDVRVWDARPMTDARKSEYRALAFVNNAFDNLFVRPAVVDRIRNDPVLSDAERKLALQLANSLRGFSPRNLNNTAWGVASRPTASASERADALRRAEAAVRMEPESGSYLNTLGVAQYRSGRYEVALETLTRSEQLNRGDGESPIDLVFLAMAQQRLLNTGRASALLQRVQQAVKLPKWSEDEELRGFLKEAEAIIIGDATPN